MKEALFIFILLISGLTTSFSQSTKAFYVETGGTYSTFQDVKYSKVSFGGIGGILKLGWHQDKPNSLWSVGLDFNFGSESPNTHSAGNTNIIHPKIFARYLKKINDRLTIGGQWEILGLYLRNAQGLDNNGTNFITSSDLFASGTYRTGKFNFGLDLGLLSFFKERTSFAFSASQNVLENGDFNYQDESLASPFGFKYFVLNPFTNHLNLRTKITYKINRRFSVGYQWGVRHFAQVKNYPVTIGNHQILMRYNIAPRTKSKGTSTTN